MNKYEQALKNVRAKLRVSNGDINILQELVNKATSNRVKQRAIINSIKEYIIKGW